MTATDTLDRLNERLSKETRAEVRFDRGTRGLYATDASLYQIEPLGVVVPRSAVVFDETGPHLFTVSGGKAHRIFVQVGLDQGDAIEVSGTIGAGAQVAVEGAYELQDGMPVKVRGR